MVVWVIRVTWFVAIAVLLNISNVEAQNNQNEEQCSDFYVEVEQSGTNDVVAGQAIGSPCSPMLEITNLRNYWVNLEVLPQGGASVTPVGGADNLYATYGILAPNAVVRYEALFTSVGQSIRIEVDVTSLSGEGARMMNLLEAIIDAVSLTPSLSGVELGYSVLLEHYPEVVNTFASTRHLQAAGSALYSINPDLAIFTQEMVLASQEGEFSRIGQTLENIGIAGAKVIIEQNFADIASIFGTVNVIKDNYQNAFQLLLGHSAGFVGFATRVGQTIENLSEILIGTWQDEQGNTIEFLSTEWLKFGNSYGRYPYRIVGGNIIEITAFGTTRLEVLGGTEDSLLIRSEDGVVSTVVRVGARPSVPSDTPVPEEALVAIRELVATSMIIGGDLDPYWRVGSYQQAPNPQNLPAFVTFALGVPEEAWCIVISPPIFSGGREIKNFFAIRSGLRWTVLDEAATLNLEDYFLQVGCSEAGWISSSVSQSSSDHTDEQGNSGQNPDNTLQPELTYFTDAFGVAMVTIPTGTFVMGSTEEQAIQAIESCMDDTTNEAYCSYYIRASTPAHQVTLSSYSIDVFETTNAQYRQCLDQGFCSRIPKCAFSDAPVYDENYDNHAVECVSWEQAANYCAWRNARLPTEAEWEYAARGPNNNVFPWGNEFNQDIALAIVDSQRATIGTNPFDISWAGIHDLIGGQPEWVNEKFDYQYYSYSPANDPTGVSAGYSLARGNSGISEKLYTMQAMWRGSEHPLPGEELHNFLPIKTVRCVR